MLIFTMLSQWINSENNMCIKYMCSPHVLFYKWCAVSVFRVSLNFKFTTKISRKVNIYLRYATYQTTPVNDESKASDVSSNGIGCNTWRTTVWSRDLWRSNFVHYVPTLVFHVTQSVFQLLPHSFPCFGVDDINLFHLLTQQSTAVANVDGRFCTTRMKKALTSVWISSFKSLCDSMSLDLTKFSIYENYICKKQSDLACLQLEPRSWCQPLQDWQ